MKTRLSIGKDWAAVGLASSYLHRYNGFAHAAAVPGCGSLHRCLDKIVLGHSQRGGDNLIDSIMRAVENNGAVTLPVTRSHRHGWKIVAGVVVAMALIAFVAATLLG